MMLPDSLSCSRIVRRSLQQIASINTQCEHIFAMPFTSR